MPECTEVVYQLELAAVEMPAPGSIVLERRTE